MARQHATPILLTEGGGATALAPLGLTGGADAVSEAALQQLIHDHPSCLPIAEIDPLFCAPVSICTELNTPAGPIDNFLVTASGLPVLVECKLWRNPEMRRQVVSQILDYAKELSRWSSSDLQREASRRLGRTGNSLLELVREAGHQVDEANFNDALTANLRRGRFLLLIVGDGIREGVEAIVEYLQAHAGLHFTLGLVELPIYSLASGDRIVVPRILARTHVIRREVIATPDGFIVTDEDSAREVSQATGPDPLREERKAFFEELLAGYQLTDPEQAKPQVTPSGYLFLYMPAPKSSCWINVSARVSEMGIFLSANRGTVGDKALQTIVAEWSEVAPLIGGHAEVKPWQGDNSRFWIAEFQSLDVFTNESDRKHAIGWLRERIDVWVSVLRPRIRAIVTDLLEAES